LWDLGGLEIPERVAGSGRISCAILGIWDSGKCEVHEPVSKRMEMVSWKSPNLGMLHPAILQEVGGHEFTEPYGNSRRLSPDRRRWAAIKYLKVELGDSRMDRGVRGVKFPNKGRRASYSIAEVGK